MNNNISYNFIDESTFRKITIGRKEIEFIYTYTLSKHELIEMAPKNNSIIVNLHNWNGALSISKEAEEYAQTLGVKLLTLEDFYGYIRENRLDR